MGNYQYITGQDSLTIFKQLLQSLTFQERLAALEECQELGRGFQLAERDMGIRGFGTIFGEQQTGNVGIDFFFEMLFESLSKACFMMDFIISYTMRKKKLCLIVMYLMFWISLHSGSFSVSSLHHVVLV